MTDYRPQRPSHSLSSSLWTYQDAIEHLLDVFDTPRTDLKVLRQMKRSVLRAYRDLPNKHRWRCYKSRRILTTAPSQTTGTCAFDLAGGAYERVVTLSGATFPATARFYRINIGGVHYPLDTYESSTEVTLPENENPGADVAAGTSYTLYRDCYPLPVDFRKLGWLFDVTAKREIRDVPAEDVHAHSVFFGSPSTPSMAAIHEAGEFFGGMQLQFGPPPSTARTYDMTYLRHPRPLLVEKLNTGTVSTSGTTVTCSDSVFDANKHVGSVIRFSSDTNDPTGPAGDADDSDNPYTAQRIIQSVTSATEVVIDTALSAEVTSKNYVVSDPLDLNAGAMLTYFLRLCETEFSRLANREDRHERRSGSDRELLEAMAADSRVFAPSELGADAMTPFHKREWSTISDEVVNASV